MKWNIINIFLGINIFIWIYQRSGILHKSVAMNIKNKLGLKHNCAGHGLRTPRESFLGLGRQIGSVNLESKLWRPGFFKKRTKLTILSTFSIKDSEFRSFFGRIEDTIFVFRDLLTCISGWHTHCSPEHIAPWHTLQTHTLLLRTVCSSTNLDPWNTLLPKTLCSPAHFASWNTLLLGPLSSQEHLAPL